MWSFGPHDEHRQLDVIERERVASRLEAALGKVVVQKQRPQILDVHTCRHTRAVGIPRHQIIRMVAFPQHVCPYRVRPDQIVGLQHRERPAHLLAAEKALSPYDIAEKIQLVLGDEKIELSGLGEIGLGREQRQAGQTLVIVPSHASQI